MDNKDKTVTINVTKAKERIKKVFKTILILIFFIAAYCIICKPAIMGNLLSKTEKATAVTKTKEVQEMYVLIDEIVVMYTDSSYETATNITDLAIELTASTGKQYAEDNGKLVMFEDGKLKEVKITEMKLK
jgi:flagellar basal body-associated protein FliL